MSLLTLSVNGPGAGPESFWGREDVIMMRLKILILKDDERKETTNRVLCHWNRDGILVSVRLLPGTKFPTS